MHAQEGAEFRPKIHGRRTGRKLRPGQQQLMDVLLPRLAVAAEKPVDLKALFPERPEAIWLEVGFGGGEHLADQATAHPTTGLIGCEVFRNGIASLLGHIEKRHLGNVRICTEDARMLLDALPAASLSRVFLLFLDPWPKKRHSGRRFINTESLNRLAMLMKPGAELRIASDDPVHIAWALAHASNHPAFSWTARTAADWCVRPQDWPATRYEQKAVAAGRQPMFFRFLRR